MKEGKDPPAVVGGLERRARAQERVDGHRAGKMGRHEGSERLLRSGNGVRLDLETSYHVRRIRGMHDMVVRLCNVHREGSLGSNAGELYTYDFIPHSLWRSRPRNSMYSPTSILLVLLVWSARSFATSVEGALRPMYHFLTSKPSRLQVAMRQGKFIAFLSDAHAACRIHLPDSSILLSTSTIRWRCALPLQVNPRYLRYGGPQSSKDNGSVVGTAMGTCT